MDKTNRFSKWLNNKYTSCILLVLASLGYSIQSWIYSQNQKSYLDEGFYLLKGYLFATGKYTPFQAYGTWTNKMPLAFLIPGYVQRILGPGLRTGRLYAFILSILILVGAIILGYRLAGKWGGALAAILLALNPATLKIYSMAISEVLIVFLLITSMVFVLGKNRTLWQILFGSFLAGMIPVTRINMLPVLPLLILYIFWEHGRKKGIYGTLVSLVPFIGVHLIFWPGIIELWARWIPKSLIPAVEQWSVNIEGTTRLPLTERTILDRFVAFIEGVRYHFPAVMGIFTSIFFWPKKWSTSHQKKISILLISLFSLLFAMHFWNSITLDFNVFAFSVYLGFFDILGILLVITTVNNWNLDTRIPTQIIMSITLFIISLGIAYASSEVESSYGLSIQGLLTRRALSFEGGKIVLAPWKWWEVFKGRLGWEYSTTVKITGVLLFMLVALILTFGVSYLLKYLNKTNEYGKKPTISYILVSFLVLGIILTPTDFLGGSRHIYDCQPGVISTYEKAADEISLHIDDEEQVLWIGTDTEVVLIELMEKKSIKIFPQSLNTRYTFRFGGNTDQLASRGFWNEELAQDWIDQSDTLLFEEQAINGWFKHISPLVDMKDFIMVGETSMTGCSSDERILIFQRSQ